MSENPSVPAPGNTYPKFPWTLQRCMLSLSLSFSLSLFLCLCLSTSFCLSFPPSQSLSPPTGSPVGMAGHAARKPGHVEAPWGPC